MLSRLLNVVLVLVAAAVVHTALIRAEERAVECTVVQAGDGKMTVTDPGGNQKTAAVARDAKITLDGKECKWSDLKSGMKVRLSVRKEGGQPVIVGVEVVSK
jgi:biopolymer transport protein ExbD